MSRSIPITITELREILADMKKEKQDKIIIKSKDMVKQFRCTREEIEFLFNNELKDCSDIKDNIVLHRPPKEYKGLVVSVTKK